MDVNGARILITGASRGIGKTIAERLANSGARVALVARNAEQLTQLAEQLNGTAHPCDLADPKQVDGLIERVEREAGGPIDVLINNAGLDEIGLLTDKSAEDSLRIHQVNLLTPIELCRQVIPGMTARGKGQLVNVTSSAACGAFSGMSLYASTKAGLANFTRVLRFELKGLPLTVTDVAIGPVPTEMLVNIGNEFSPARRSFARLRHLQLMPNTTTDRVADAVIDAIRTESKHVRLPRRSAIYPAMADFPQRLVQLTLIGIPTRPKA
jgi:uncharacterized protein